MTTSDEGGPRRPLAPWDTYPLDRGARPDMRLANRQDRLDYIASMALTLKTLAARAGCPALVDMLDLAHREATRQADGVPE